MVLFNELLILLVRPNLDFRYVSLQNTERQFIS